MTNEIDSTQAYAVDPNADVVTYENGIKYVETTIGEKRVKMRKLRGDEVRTLQRINGSFSAGSIWSDMALASIVSIGEKKFVAVQNDMHLDERAKALDDDEYIELGNKYAEHFRKDIRNPKPVTS